MTKLDNFFAGENTREMPLKELLSCLSCHFADFKYSVLGLSLLTSLGS